MRPAARQPLTPVAFRASVRELASSYASGFVAGGGDRLLDEVEGLVRGLAVTVGAADAERLRGEALDDIAEVLGAQLTAGRRHCPA